MHLDLVFLHVHRLLSSHVLFHVFIRAWDTSRLCRTLCVDSEYPFNQAIGFPVLSRAKWRRDCRIKPPAPIFHLKALLLTLQKLLAPILRSCVARIMIQLHSIRIRFQQLLHLKSGWRGDNLEGFVWQQRKGKINIQETQE